MPHRRPNLFLVGAPCAGVPLLQDILATHPCVYVTEPRQTGAMVFQDEAQRIWKKENFLPYAGNLSAYLNLYKPAKPDHKWRIDACSWYAMAPLVKDVPQRIAHLNDQAHIIYLMRDPSQRILAHYQATYADRRPWQRDNLANALVEDNRLICASEYHSQLSLFLQQFNKDKVYVLTYEKLVSHTSAAVTNLCNWLALDPPETSKGLSTNQQLARYNQQTDTANQYLNQLNKIAPILRFQNQKLAELLQDGLMDKMPGWLSARLPDNEAQGEQSILRKSGSFPRTNSHKERGPRSICNEPRGP